jgi:hypothetical protein
MASPSRLHRLNYFDGRLLTAEDFRTEQAYQLGRARRHNRHVHGWGVINGLDVRVVGNFVEVSPGAAIDCAGNELVVENGVALSMPQDARRLVVLMRYVEHGVDPLPTIATDAGAGEALNFSHIEEGCELDLSEDAWTDPHPALAPCTPGCGEAHDLAIARLNRTRSGWRRTLLARRG